MPQRFAEIAFTPAVQAEQETHGSRRQYERIEKFGPENDRLGPDEQSFIEFRDGFYMGTVSETGWPYIQYRGGPKGFLRVLDDKTLAFADFRGNRQYISVGNLRTDGRVSLFLMDYPSRTRLKLLGRAEIIENDSALTERLRMPGYAATIERAVVVHLEAYDWNCQQHITPRWSQEELTDALASIRQRVTDLEAENVRLREQLEARQAVTAGGHE